ncbi:hypothetical protein [Microbacterium neungamense]|uniref:hypothetical protein n=1 Tax=Microbacterium neungamense TaxID=2810535 RepID=UPI00217E1630|nr:hypothetical protein [Microbacterium neungamense]
MSLYTDLQQVLDSDIVTLNKAIAVAEAESADAGLSMLDTLDLDGYHHLHAARGELLHRLGRNADARAEFARAWEFADNELDRGFLARRLQELTEQV